MALSNRSSSLASSTQQSPAQRYSAQQTPSRQIQSRNTTPQSAPALPVTPSPGTWRHPRFEEIARRQQAATFTDKNVTTLLWNIGALYVPIHDKAISSNTNSPILHPLLLDPISSTLGDWPPWSLRSLWNYLIPLLLLYNIYTAASPLFLRKDAPFAFLRTDEFADIPLTPTQRSLLGLDPNAGPPATPGTQFLTPPRYPRSATPKSGTPGSRGSSNAGSPASRKDSPLGRLGSGAEFSPSGSPLWQKTVGGKSTARRHSYGIPSPLGPGGAVKEGSIFGVPSTPSPTAGKGASVPLNSRWLYERGRSDSGSRSVYM
ncbi:hypothetical protein MMC34_002208 [Xylographa carneopallida]|nr:hypothetical protein [Xylographa carneopallida]